MRLSGRHLLPFILFVFFSIPGTLLANAKLLPFILASSGPGDLGAKADEVKKALQSHGFEVVGAYSPYPNAESIVVTSDDLKQAAGGSEMGGFAAAERVSVTKVGDQVQVAYVNPAYMAGAFRLGTDLKNVADKLEAALGKVKAFGSKEGMTDEDLRDYHYMFGMPYFDDPDKLNTFGSYQEGVKQVESALAKGVAGTSKVYRIDIPGKQQTLFGVAMTEGFSGDAKIMGLIDNDELKHTAHLPYEVLVSGNKAWALNARFRIAIDFPDLSMMGKGSFMEIMDAPPAIKEVLTQVAGGVL